MMRLVYKYTSKQADNAVTHGLGPSLSKAQPDFLHGTHGELERARG